MIILLVVAWICIALLVGFLADARGRRFEAWFAFGLLFGVFALVPVVCMENQRRKRDVWKSRQAEGYRQALTETWEPREPEQGMSDDAACELIMGGD